MKGPFNDQAQKVIELARKEAKRLGAKYIGTEHLLIGILSEGESAAAKTLKSLGIGIQEVRAEVEAICGRGISPGKQEIVFTPGVKRVFEFAFQHAKVLEDNFMGVEHLLLGILRDSNDIATRILMQLGADPSLVEKEMSRMLETEKNQYGFRPSGRTPELDNYSLDLTRLARKDKLGLLLDRPADSEHVIQILFRRSKNAPLLISESGICKFAVVKEVARRIARCDTPEYFWDRRVITLNLNEMVTDILLNRPNVKEAINELTFSSQFFIVYVEDLDAIVKSRTRGSQIALDLLRMMLSREELRLIVSATPKGYRKNIKNVIFLERNLHPVFISAPKFSEKIDILRNVRNNFEARYKVKIDDDMLRLAAKLAERYIPDGFLPEKAIDLLDEAASRISVRKLKPPAKLSLVENMLRWIQSERKISILAGQSDKAAVLEEEEKNLLDEKEKLEIEWEKEKKKMEEEVFAVSFKDIADMAMIRFDIFLCYNKSDRKSVKDIEEKLKEEDIISWSIDSFVPPGRNWSEEIDALFPLIKNAAVFIGSGDSPPWKDEENRNLLERFIENDKIVIPVILPGVVGNPDLPVFLKNKKPVDFRLNDPDPIRQLIWGIPGKSPIEDGAE